MSTTYTTQSTDRNGKTTVKHYHYSVFGKIVPLSNNKPKKYNPFNKDTLSYKLFDFVNSRHLLNVVTAFISTVWKLSDIGLKCVMMHPFRSIMNIAREIALYTFCSNYVSFGIEEYRFAMTLLLIMFGCYHCKFIDTNI